jgi:tetratricopeptide (TPR) repeat protein
LQDEVASHVVGAIEPKLRRSEIERAISKPTDSQAAYDLYLRALAEFHKCSVEGMRAAVSLLKQGLVIDPSYVPAAAMIGLCRINLTAHGMGTISDTEIAESVYLATQALASGKDDPDVLWMAGDTLSVFAGEHATAASAIDRALALNPNSAHAWMASGWVSAYQGRPGQAIESLRRAIRLSPFDPLGYMFSGGLALAHLVAREYEEAAEWAERALRELPRFAPAIRVKVVSCAHLARIAEARNWLGRLLELQPGFTIAGFKGGAVRYLLPETLAVYLNGFRKAGLPEE